MRNSTEKKVGICSRPSCYIFCFYKIFLCFSRSLKSWYYPTNPQCLNDRGLMLQAFQEAAFNQVALQIKQKYPDNTLVLTYADVPVIDDFMTLNRLGKLRWDPWLKNQPFFQPDHRHPIKLAIYYRRAPLGYAFGNFSEERQSLEICWMEKRSDAHEDMDYQMLPIALTCFSAYGMLLRQQGYVVNKIAMVSPIEDVRPYYTQHGGFRYIPDYDGTICAMVLDELVA